MQIELFRESVPNENEESNEESSEESNEALDEESDEDSEEESDEESEEESDKEPPEEKEFNRKSKLVNVVRVRPGLFCIRSRWRKRFLNPSYTVILITR